MIKKKRPRKLIRRLIRIWAVPIGCGLLFLFLLKFVFFIGYVPTASMKPAIGEGSFIVGARLFGELERGDVIVFRRDGHLMVKRIAGISGDTVNLGGVPLIVPDDRYFVLGDNAESSIDSRHWDERFVAHDQVAAKVFR